MLHVANMSLLLIFVLFTVESIFIKKITPFFYMIVLYGVWVNLLVPFVLGSNAPHISHLIRPLGIIAFLQVGFYYNAKKTIDAMSLTFCIMILLNHLTMLRFPSGVVAIPGVFLFEYRTGFPYIILPGIIICILYDYMFQRDYFSWRTLLAIGFGVASIWYQWVATGVLQLLILFSLYFIALYFMKKRFLNVVLGFCIIIFVNLQLTILGSISYLLDFISYYLGRTPTLTGRTVIWANAMPILHESPIYGHGQDALVPLGTIMTTAHNQWLHWMLEGGIIGALIITIACLMSCFYVLKLRGSGLYVILSIGILNVTFASLVEIQSHVPFIYMIFALPYVVQDLCVHSHLPKPIRFVKPSRLVGATHDD